MMHSAEVSGATRRYTGCSEHFDSFHSPLFLIPYPLSAKDHMSPALLRQRPNYLTIAIFLQFYLKIFVHLIHTYISII